VSITANGEKVSTQFYMQIVCPPHEGISGIAVFPVGPTVKRKVGIVLTEAGNKSTKLEVKDVGYKF